MYEEVTMEHLVIYERSKSLVHAVIGIKAGWRDEEPGKRGISHFLEHATFLGNSEYPSPDKEVGKYGVQLDGMTLPEHTLFLFTSHAREFTKILSLFLSLIFQPDFNENRLEKEKKEKIITAVIQESDLTPWELAEEWARNLLFNWNFLLSLGTEKDIKSLSREDLTIRHKKYYHDLNSFIVVYGNIEDEEIVECIRDVDIPLSGEIPRVAEVNWNKKEIYIEREGIKNAEIVYGFKLPQYSVEWEILSVILGNYAISKLWERFSRLTYTVSSRLEWTTTGGGFFLYFGATSHDNIREIDRDLWFLLKGLEINERELEYAKNIKSLEILKMKEGGENGLLKFVFQNPGLRYKNFDEVIGEINNIRRDKVLSLAERFLNKENVIKSIVSGGK